MLGNKSYNAKILFSILGIVSLLVSFFIFDYFIDRKVVTNRGKITPNLGYQDLDTYKLEKLNNQESLAKSFNEGNFAQLNQILDYKLSLDGKDVNALIQKSLTLSQEGSLKYKESEMGSEAVPFAKQAIALDPQNVEAYRALGYAYEIQEEYTKALENYNLGLKIDPKNSGILFQIGHVYDLQGKNTFAEAKYREVLKIDENNVKANLGMGRIHTLNGKYLLAEEHFQKALLNAKIKREKSEATLSLANIYLERGELKKANEYISIALENDNKNDAAITLKGKILFSEAFDEKNKLTAVERQEKTKESFSLYSQALQINPNLTIAYYLFGKQLLLIDNKKDSLKMLNLAKEKVKNDITLSTRQKTNLENLIQVTLNIVNK